MSNELKTLDDGMLAAPSYLEADKAGADSALAEMRRYVRPPRIKIVQRTSDMYLEKGFKPGDVLMIPQLVKIAEQHQPFFFVPIYFFAQWCEQNPIALKGQAPMIRASTFDERSKIARYAKDPQQRRQPHPDYPAQAKNSDYDIRYVEYLNYVISLVNHPAAGMPCVLSFSAGEWGTGSSFGGLIMMRRMKDRDGNMVHVKPYCCQYQATVADPRKNSKGAWFGLDLSNPAPDSGVSPWVQEAEMRAYQGLALQFHEAHKADLLVVDREEDIEGTIVPDAKDTEY